MGKNIQEEEKNNNGLKFLYILLFTGIGAILVYACKNMWWYNDKGGLEANRYTDALFYLSLCLLIAGSALTVGCLTGFIFAIPKSVTDSDINLIKVSGGFVSNDNLVQVSDWLTKIIVGVGLTNLMRAPKALQSMGEYIGPAIGGTTYGPIAASSIVVYFLICGFLLAYLWTRLYFGRMLENSTEENKPIDDNKN